MNTQDVIANINRKLKDDLISNDAHAATPTLDDVLCAIVFVVFVAFVCLL